ncbi:MAG TPA: aquaporin [Acidimicrobiia bacterium]|nr:aquaporin [Acidimicrobiia bacterium]
MVINKYLAETVGTFILVLGGSMSILAVNATGGPVMAVVPFGFGLSLLAGIYAVGHVSGGHFNPAVTLAMWLDKRTSLSDLIGYWISQVVGGVVAAAVVLAASSRDAVHGTNTYPGAAIGQSTGKAFLIEFVLTLIFVMVFLASTKKAAAVAGIVIPITLVAVHLAGIPFSGASVNPARTLGPALIGGVHSSLWVYMVAPLAGAAIGWVFWRMFGGDEPQS